MTLPGGAGGLAASLYDMVSFDLALREHKVIDEALERRMHAPARLTSGRTEGYGMGWVLTSYRGRPRTRRHHHHLPLHLVHRLPINAEPGTPVRDRRASISHSTSLDNFSSRRAGLAMPVSRGCGKWRSRHDGLTAAAHSMYESALEGVPPI